MSARPEPGGEWNPYQAGPRPETPTPADLGVEELTTEECWCLVEAGQVGRLALNAMDGRPDLFPLNYLAHDGDVFVRSAPGAKLRSLAADPAVAFEVDGADDTSHWSVVIRADAQRMDVDADIEASGVLDLISWSPTSKYDFIRLVPAAITGRRFPRDLRRERIREAPGAGIPHPDMPSDTEVTDPARRDHGKPLPIPHFAPLRH